jgi:glycosyltransferase involved in cell wall biosynthesis
MNQIKVTVSCGTKFHSDYTAYQLSKHGLLDRILTAHPAKHYLNRVPLAKQKVKFLPPVFLASYGFKKLLGNSNKLSQWLDYRLPLVFDRLAAGSLNGSNVLLTWAWSGLKTIKAMKRKGGKVIVEECGSCNSFQNEILMEAYADLGLQFQSPTPGFILKRQLEEARMADYILCPSKHVASSFIRYGIEERKCKVIPYGVNIELFKPKNKEKKEFIVLFVGTVGVRKGLVYLFKALALLKEKYTLKCIVIGKLEEQFKPVFDTYAHLFTYISRVDHHELGDYYNEASVFVFPSLDEGMALVQLEAMACGLPVICTSNSGGDSVIDDGEEGYIVPVKDPVAIATCVEKLLNDRTLLKQMSNKAQKKAVLYNWDNYGEKLAKFINEIV